MIDVEKQDGQQMLICKLIDYGLSSFTDSSKRLTLSLGSEHYLAPEMLENVGEEDGSKSDIW